MNLGRGLSVWSLYVFPVLAWVSSGYSGFCPQAKEMHVRLIGGHKLPVGVIVSVHGLCVALRWTGNLSRVYPSLSPEESWERFQQIPVTLKIGVGGYGKWMDDISLVVVASPLSHLSLL